jgi:hypothetical protein
MVALPFELVTFRPKRAIDSFTSQVTFSEDHSDDVTITKHPVERGAAITDHAFKEPARLTIRAGWSQSSLRGLLDTAVNAVSALSKGDVAGLLGGVFGSDYVRDLYTKLLKLQSDRKPFDIVTGKRKYKNMMFASLATTSDPATENTLIVTATFQEVIIVETKTATLPPTANQAQPQKTAQPEASGTKQLAPAPQANQSALDSLNRLKALQAQAGG